ncbi:type II toxin-antitoxin system HicB family antitoxin [Umezawaea endophytica]|uniref:Type II toxin-antitoxin system HicB family antitoxin n=1 Tax=Umezawaea endophytica TaxID=1654476 RepID=A0A9X2VKP5_9PSEU|nr:type II toxin-antitoxin system HicB family antitoxin [Umezawaea endophytica]MCS7478400.1 type II toxin-antitoxin system HicB family antitoxin [Umezawaea endophytica]
MDLSPYIASLREDLATAASAGDDNTRRTAAALSGALEPAARLAIMNALSDLAAEVTASLDDRVVEVRLDGRDVQVVVTGGSDDSHHDDDPRQQEVPLRTAFGDATGDISRITLRLLDELKTKAEQAASTQGVSLNTFVSQAVAGALNSSRHGHGRGKGPWGHQGGPWGGHQESTKDRDDTKGGGGKSQVRGWVQG